MRGLGSVASRHHSDRLQRRIKTESYYEYKRQPRNGSGKSISCLPLTYIGGLGEANTIRETVPVQREHLLRRLVDGRWNSMAAGFRRGEA